MRKTWIHWVLAAIVILLAGAVIAAAGEERIEVKVEQDGDDEISVDINGVTEVIRIEDLADGESKVFDVGDHTIEVRRVGDALELINDGIGMGHGGAHRTMVWMTEDGTKIGVDGERVIKMKVLGDGGESGEKSYTLRMEDGDIIIDGDTVVDVEEIIMRNKGGHPHAIFVDESGVADHVKVFSESFVADGLVTYRCEKTGSTLTLAEEDAIEDSYICPATGCLMERVERPEKRVVIIEKKVEIDEE